MISNLKAPNDQNAPRTEVDESVEEKKKILDLSLTQIVGGALAAMTAAALGSTLGVAGTIAGAALASVVAGVAGSLYTTSLRTGRDKVRTVFRASNLQSQVPDVASAPPSPYYQPRSVDETLVAPGWDDLPHVKLTKPKKTAARFPWKRAVAISVAVFALAAVLITGYERVSGQPLSGGKGTTVSQVSNDNSADPKETKPTPSASASSSPTASSSTSPAASATPAVGTAPSASEPQSPTPSVGASTPAATPSASAASAAAGQ